VGCLGQTGEQDELPAYLEETSVMRDVGPFRFRVPAPEEQVTLATLQRMYRHLRSFHRPSESYGPSGSGHLDFNRLQASPQRRSIWPGVATLLKITSDYNQSVGLGRLPLPAFVVGSARFGAEVTHVEKQFLRVPMLPHCSQLFKIAFASRSSKARPGPRHEWEGIGAFSGAFCDNCSASAEKRFQAQWWRGFAWSCCPIALRIAD
jgi:hypothetical protein